MDDLFGVRHDGTETQADFFGGRLWVETDQDRAFSFRRYAELFATVDCKLVDGYALAEKVWKHPERFNALAKQAAGFRATKAAATSSAAASPLSRRSSPASTT